MTSWSPRAVGSRSRLIDAREEADRIVADRLAGLAELTDEIAAQAEALRRQSEALQRALAQANSLLLVMDADPDESFIRGKMKGGPLPRGRGLLMAEDTGVFVQVAATELRK